ncbi:PREDICTED: oil body-associated protein 2B-like [Nelumbo nucifera]|uniref:Oil body-associated protein 2B-like n=1 Tax=Nelumbo nucifera TaxID=4432 RepID=A0A1U8B0V0_NELNU|nr:PREDICTED: oil body-associated protein 2B-like [Nelumbo nucifera]
MTTESSVLTLQVSPSFTTLQQELAAPRTRSFPCRSLAAPPPPPRHLFQIFISFFHLPVYNLRPLFFPFTTDEKEKRKKGSRLQAIMASSDQPSGTIACDAPTPGQPLTMGTQVLDAWAKMMQGMKPIKHIQQHVCTFAMYSHDMTRQIETHHFVTRLNQDFLQCAVYNSDCSSARLIGVEYIVSDRIFEALPPEEQQLWHSHAYEIKAGLWVNPRVPEMMQKVELQNLAKTYGKFWCTWQVDRGDRLPLGAPSLMMSPQAVKLAMVKPELVQKRDEKYSVSSEGLKKSRVEIEEPEWINPNADYWRKVHKGFAIDIEETEMKRMAPFP